METKTEAALAAAGFVRCPNVRDRWYAGGPGIMEPTYPLEIRAHDDTVELVANPHGRPTSDAVVLLRFAVVEDLLGFLREHGRPSLPGLPAFSNSWD
jgi:hypothetical protein